MLAFSVQQRVVFLVDGGLLRLLLVRDAGGGQQVDPGAQRQHVAVLLVGRPAGRVYVSRYRLKAPYHLSIKL